IGGELAINAVQFRAFFSHSWRSFHPTNRSNVSRINGSGPIKINQRGRAEFNPSIDIPYHVQLIGTRDNQYSSFFFFFSILKRNQCSSECTVESIQCMGFLLLQ
uniref:Uncharacterized protein n=1 Tax=Oryza brachyantha TaxID=4533 RepID=J3N2R3_ORYBR